MSDESKKYLTINTHKGLYQFNRFVFGVASAPAIWQRSMEQILQGIPGVHCILDDMMTGQNDTESNIYRTWKAFLINYRSTTSK